MQLVWSTLLAAHLALAIVWLWLMPGGFPHAASEFWVNQVAPWVVLVWAIIALIGRSIRGGTIVPPLLLAIPAFWIAFGASARIHFLISSGALWAVALSAGMVLAMLWFREHAARRELRWMIPFVVALALWAGWRTPITQRAPDASTRPTATAMPPAPTGSADSKIIRFGKDAQLRPAEGRLVVRRDDHLLTIAPLLTIESRSPDRAMVSLAPPEENRATARRLDAVSHEGARWTMHYRGDAAMLEASATRDGAIELDAHTQLTEDVYTHLNTYAELALRGHKHLTLRFSPVPTLRVDVPPFTERARFAYLDEAGLFHVAEAHNLEKGPFVDLGTGKLGREEPLVIQLYDGDTLIYTVRFDDWTRQLSTALSPTAGWGVPVNVIHFMRASDALDAPAMIALSLAATGIGRGWQSVGYKAGVYRNRMRIESR